jgi:hypothetical protein
MNIKQAIETVSLKDLIESTGRQAASGNAAKGEYLYSAPYREDNDPSLKINVFTKKFIDYGQDDAKGDVIQLARLIMGNGNAHTVSVSEALQWLRNFSGRVVAATPAKPIQHREKPASVVSFEGDRYKLLKAEPITAKSHPNNVAYVTDVRKVSLAVATRYIQIISYKDTAAPEGDVLKGVRYGIGTKNDAGGYEVRAASIHSNFKTSIGQKDITSFNGHPNATVGDIFEGQFDFLTYLEIAGETVNYNPSIILNTGRFAARAAQIIKQRDDFRYIQRWRFWHHNDDEGHRSTQVLIEQLGDDYRVETQNHLHDGFNDLNECWTKAEPQRRMVLNNQIKQLGQKNVVSQKHSGPNTELKPKL